MKKILLITLESSLIQSQRLSGNGSRIHRYIPSSPFVSESDQQNIPKIDNQSISYNESEYVSCVLYK